MYYPFLEACSPPSLHLIPEGLPEDQITRLSEVIVYTVGPACGTIEEG
jgi:hypothetical protein